MPTAARRRDGLGPAIRELATGARAVVNGVIFVVKSEGAFRAALPPAAIAFGIGAGSALLGEWGVVRTGRWIFGTTGDLAAIGRTVFDVAVGIAALLVAVVVAVAVAQPLTHAALARLTDRLARSIGADTPTYRPTRLFASAELALATLGITLPALGSIEALTIFAPRAAVVTEPLAFVVTALAVAWELFDQPMSRRGIGGRARLRWMKRNAWLVLGFAVTTQLLLLVPVLDFFLLPVGALGAAKLIALRGVDGDE